MGVVIVTYNPRKSLLKLIERVLLFAQFILIVDNGSSNTKILDLCENIPGVQIKYLRENTGVATALNLGMDKAISAGLKHVALFDQDSIPVKDYLEHIKMAYATWHGLKPVAVLGVNYTTEIGDNKLTGYAQTGKLLFANQTAITSGSIINCEAYENIGPFRDEFFIDHVDHEFCLRARAHGYEVLVVEACLISHMIGRVELIPIGRWNILLTNHSAERRYYQRRNFLFLLKEYWRTESIWCLQMFIKELLGGVTMLCEKDRFRKLGYSLWGLWDGIRGCCKHRLL
ncbi:glycosyltransferase family 2 protein [Maridesulfovibrio sp.]|uniref:glycosyltransferase family 2 protein n=1 Tax=Maridesulfovibrio sp. TaxID=2795000 RepID=UPI003BA9CD4B